MSCVSRRGALHGVAWHSLGPGLLTEASIFSSLQSSILSVSSSSRRPSMMHAVIRPLTSHDASNRERGDDQDKGKAAQMCNIVQYKPPVAHVLDSGEDLEKPSDANAAQHGEGQVIVPAHDVDDFARGGGEAGPDAHNAQCEGS